MVLEGKKALPTPRRKKRGFPERREGEGTGHAELSFQNVRGNGKKFTHALSLRERSVEKRRKESTVSRGKERGTKRSGKGKRPHEEKPDAGVLLDLVFARYRSGEKKLSRSKFAENREWSLLPVTEKGSRGIRTIILPGREKDDSTSLSTKNKLSIRGRGESIMGAELEVGREDRKFQGRSEKREEGAGQFLSCDR